MRYRAPGQQKVIDDPGQQLEDRLGRGPVDDWSVTVLDEAPPSHRSGSVAEEQDGDPAPFRFDVMHTDQL